jgi:hypothetical protein
MNKVKRGVLNLEDEFVEGFMDATSFGDELGEVRVKVYPDKLSLRDDNACISSDAPGKRSCGVKRIYVVDADRFDKLVAA